MQVSSILAGYPDPTALGKRGETGEAAASRPAETVQLDAASAAGRAAALAEILSRYDVTDICPTEFSEMIQKLYEAGAISENELQQLAAIRLELDTEGVEADESIDLLEFYVDKIEKAQRRLEDSDDAPASRQQLGPMLRRLDWVQKFALIQSAPDAIGLDATA